MFSLEAYKQVIHSIVSTMGNNSIEIDSGTVRLNYSGRGMFGSTCLGIVLHRYDMDSFKVEMAESIHDAVRGRDDDDEVAVLFKKLKECLKSPNRDSMGMSQIEYFQSLTIPTEYLLELNEIICGYVYEE